MTGTTSPFDDPMGLALIDEARERGYIDADAHRRACRESDETGHPPAQVLLRLGLLDVDQLAALIRPIATGVDPDRGDQPAEASDRSSSGRYRAGEEIGRGGMGEVLVAHDRNLHREVALKRLSPAALRRETAIPRFVEEARVTARLDHPNIVAVHELGATDDGCPFFAMRRIAGESLSSIIKRLAAGDAEARRRYGLNRRAQIFLSVCNAVAYAHAQGVLHRDLKPQNVMVGAFGEVLVVDWGLAGLSGTWDAGGDDAMATRTESGRLTREGTVMGTPGYMAPEQARSATEEIDQRSDVFGLGAILYELVALRPPRDGRTAAELIEQAIAGRTVPLADARSAGVLVPGALEAIVDKAMAHHRDDRYASVEELTGDIEAYLGGFPVSAQTVGLIGRGWKWARRHAAISAAVGVALLAIGGSLGAVMTVSSAARRREAARLRVRIAELENEAFVGASEPGDDARSPFTVKTELLQSVRELRRLAPDDPSARSALIDVTCDLAMRIDRDRGSSMAELLLDEARGAGLDPEREQFERWRIARERSEREQETIRRVEDLLEQARVTSAPLRPDPGELHDVAAEATPRVVGILIRAIFGKPWERLVAIDLLGMIGDARTKAIVDAPGIGEAVQLDLGTGGIDASETERHRSRLVALHRRVRDRWLGGGATEIRLDAVEALTLKALAVPVRRTNWHYHVFDPRMEAVAIARALGRLRDPRAKEALDARRWEAGYRSLYWRLTDAGHRRVPLPGAPDEPLSADGLRERALLTLGHGDHAAALTALDEAIALAPPADLAELHLLRGLAREASEQPDGALADLDRAVTAAIDPRDAAEGRTERARLRLAAGEVDAALADLAAIPEEALSPRALALRGAARHARGEPAAALEDLERALALDPLLATSQLERGHVLVALGRVAEAGLAFAEAARLDPTLAEAPIELSRVQTAHGMTEAAIAASTAALLADPDRAHLAWLRRHEAMSTTPLDAEWFVQQRLNAVQYAIELRPSSPEALVMRARLNVANPSRAIVAIADLTKALSVRPGHAEAHLLRARASAYMGNQDPALDDAARALAKRADWIEARLFRAELRRDKADLPGSWTDVRRALELDPELPDAYRVLGTVLLKLGDPDGAIAAFENGLARAGSLGEPFASRLVERLSEGLVDAYLHRARRRHALHRDPRGARADAWMAIEAWPEAHLPWGYFARLLRDAGDVEGLREALSKVPDGRADIREYLEAMIREATEPDGGANEEE